MLKRLGLRAQDLQTNTDEGGKDFPADYELSTMVYRPLLITPDTTEVDLIHNSYFVYLL